MTDKLGTSRTLGFWNKHLLAMDELYAYYPFEPESHPDEDFPAELLDIWNGPERDQISKVFDQAEAEAQMLVRACVADAVKWFSQSSSPFRAEASVTRDRRKARARIRPTRGAYSAGGELWLTLALENSSDNRCMTLYGILTCTRGRKNAGREMADVLNGAVAGGQVRSADDWGPQDALFYQADFDHFESQDGLSIDLDGLRSAFDAGLRKQDLDTLKKLEKRVKDVMKLS